MFIDTCVSFVGNIDVLNKSGQRLIENQKSLSESSKRLSKNLWFRDFLFWIFIILILYFFVFHITTTITAFALSLLPSVSTWLPSAHRQLVALGRFPCGSSLPCIVQAFHWAVDCLNILASMSLLSKFRLKHHWWQPYCLQITFSPNSFICFSVWNIKESAWVILSIFSPPPPPPPLLFFIGFSICFRLFFIFSISASDNPEEASISWFFCSLPVPWSLADTFKIPLASISNVTSIWGTPLGAGRNSTKWTYRSNGYPLPIDLSPCNTWISTEGWIVWGSTGIFLTLRRNRSIWFNQFSHDSTHSFIPNDNGVTSNKRTSLLTSYTPPWIAAPIATTFISGLHL